MTETFLAGFGRVDITPEKYGPLGGYGDEPYRICDNILDHTMATCVALTDGAGETILLFSLDLLKGQQLKRRSQALRSETCCYSQRWHFRALRKHYGKAHR